MPDRQPPKKEQKYVPKKNRTKLDKDLAAADIAGSLDPYMSRNEFKPGFYDQIKPPITPATMYGTASGKTTFEEPVVSPDDAMMNQEKMVSMMMDGGSVRGQKDIQVKKKIFRGVF